MSGGDAPEAGARCPQCGSVVRARVDQFCASCGYPLFWEEPQEELGERAAGMGRLPGEAAPAEAGTVPAQRQTVSEPPAEAASSPVACPACHAANPASRTLCQRCGAALHAPPPDQPPPHQRPRPPLPRPRTGSWWLAITAVGVLLVVLVVLVTFVLPGRGGRPPATSEAGASSATLPGNPAVLPVARASATSKRPPTADGIHYEARLVLDGNPATAWVTSTGRQVGEKLTLVLAHRAVVTEIDVANGYQKSGQQFRGNGRATGIRVTFDDGSVRRVTLQDRQGLQRLSLAGGGQALVVPTTRLVLQIVAVHPPDAPNVAISAVVPRGYPG